MRYVWKFLSLITAVLLTICAVPTALIARLHLWLCRKANPEFDAMATLLTKARNQDPNEVGNAIAEMMKAMHPDVVADAKAAADKVVKERTRPFAWEPETNSLPVINPVIPRVPNLPPVPPTAQSCCK